MKTIFSLLIVCDLLAMSAFAATQTENYGIPVLPAPGKIVIDGRFDDWDLTGGIFACNNVEEQRDRHSAWLHAMYDKDNLYVLARVKTQKPAESRQLRLLMLTGAGTPSQLQPNFSCSRDQDGKPLISLSFEPPLKNGRDPGQFGAEQAYLDDPDGTGYRQEIRIPLKLITADGVSLGAGSEIRVLFILAFGWSLDAWDCFMPGVLLERTYWGTRKLDQFGPATFERSGKMKPRMLHLADGRKLPVSLKQGQPVVDWSALSEGPKGFIPVKLTMPEAGYVSMILRNADGVVVRNLLNAEPMAKGEHTVTWDGLATPIWRTPGAVLPAGHYTWQAIWHKGIGLRLRGWAGNSGNAPWHSGPTSNWGGDLGVPWTCAAQGDSVYLGWGAAEAGRGLLACDLDGNVRWKHKYGGFGGAELLAVEGDLVYVGNSSGSPQVLFRLDTATGSYQNWDQANNSGFRDIFVKDLWKDQPGMPDKAEAMAARNDKDKTTVFWSDENGDQQKQDGEKTVVPMLMSFNGYLNFSLGLNTDLTLYAGVLDPKSNRWDRGARIRLAGFTPCGAPKWDPTNLHFLPPLEGPMPSPANDLVLSCDSEKQLFNCYDVASGKLRWSYPNTFHGVHGSHNAPGPQTGLIRGAFGAVGSVTLPDPVGSAWVINSNVGEWHMLTRDGFYLTRLFQGDYSKVQWPEKAVPGAVLDNVPCGEGGEDFGGSIAQGKDGKLYVTAGKTANWNVEVVGLETVKPLDSGKLRLEEKDLKLAETIRSELVQRSAGLRRCEVRKKTPVFTGDLVKDFGNEIVFKKQDDAEVRSAIAWDATSLYLGWRVADATPWTNGADSPEFMYARGDTVDFQLGTDPETDENRAEAAKGDLRLSIGNFRGKPTAVLYRKIADQKNPKTFSSGVVRNYVMDSVVVLQDAKIEVKKGDRWCVVEIAAPLATLGLKPFAGMKLSGDFGATHGTPAGDDTLLRTYWNNQATGLVNDEVFELKMEPKNWGQILFTE